ncbi:MAG: Oligopeptide/dipeptide transporter ATP-binding protein [Nocardioidaceae bacterium]|nr:Oligopeptide/dipeptide transporter ATP-binding protein [Nocardioidaceae bacterium]
MSLLDIQGLSVALPHLANRPLLDEISLYVERGEAVGLVGESGSGKSVTARAVQGLLPPKARTGGRVLVDGVDVLTAGRDAVRTLRTTKVSMVFQDPRAGINPLRRIGDFLTESARLCRGMSADAATARALELLEAVGLPDPQRHLRQHPHELSGGMLQRVMIASALMNEPELLLCDEPTTALDVTTQAEIVAILGRLQREQQMGVLFITHDLDLASALCDRVYVMYAGRVVEHALAKELFAAPLHPYTAGLLASTPGVDRDQERLVPVRGTPLSLLDQPEGCAFAERCDYVVDHCRTDVPELTEHDGRAFRCLRSAEIADTLVARAGRVAS